MGIREILKMDAGCTKMCFTETETCTFHIKVHTLHIDTYQNYHQYFVIRMTSCIMPIHLRFAHLTFSLTQLPTYQSDLYRQKSMKWA